MRFTYGVRVQLVQTNVFAEKLREITRAHFRQTSTPTDGDNRNTRIVRWRIECQRYFVVCFINSRRDIFTNYIYTSALIPNGILCAEFTAYTCDAMTRSKREKKTQKWWLIIFSGIYLYVRVMVVQFPGLKVSWLLNQYLIRIPIACDVARVLQYWPLTLNVLSTTPFKFDCRLDNDEQR